MTAPEVPLRPEEIDAAQAIYEKYTAEWRGIDGAFAALAKSMPGFDSSAVLIKAAAVNSLYSTNVFDIFRVAQHVEKVLGLADIASAGPELVEEMAAVPLPGDRILRFQSFAAKFAHFFLDHDRFPILDTVAARMLRDHLGRRAPTLVEPHLLGGDPGRGITYMAFAEAFRTLAQESGLQTSTRQLHRYMWIVGGYRKWLRSPGSVNAELRTVYEADPPELRVAAGIWYSPPA